MEPTEGATINATTGDWSYTPDTNFNGDDTFTVTVTDDDGNEEGQVINVTVNPVNDAATFGGDTTRTGSEDTASTGTLTASDPDGFSNADFIRVTDGANGVATIISVAKIADRNFVDWTYTPIANFDGTDGFTLMITDDDGNAESQVINVTVTPVNDPAIFGGDISGTGAEDTTIEGTTLTATDIADGLTNPNFTVSADGANGVASIDAVTGCGVIPQIRTSMEMIHLR